MAFTIGDLLEVDRPNKKEHGWKGYYGGPSQDAEHFGWMYFRTPLGEGLPAPTQKQIRQKDHVTMRLFPFSQLQYDKLSG